MISLESVAAQSSPNRDVSADGGHQGPMAQQQFGLGGYDSHPQKLMQLVGCRDLNAGSQKTHTAVPTSGGTASRQQR
jgi:hypothetical protein